LIIQYDSALSLQYCAQSNMISSQNDVQKIISVNARLKCWQNDIQLEALIFHELGHCILGRDHDMSLLPKGYPKSMMYPANITFKKIEHIFPEWNNENSPVCAVGLVKNDSLIFAKGYGMANLEYGVSITPETIFHMAYVSKQFTAYSIVLLAKQGKLKLDDD